MLPVISASFHGRDIFSPVAAHLASGVDYATVGPTISIDALARLPVIRPTVGDGDLASVVVHDPRLRQRDVRRDAGGPRAAIGPLSLGRPLTLEFPAHGGAPAVEERTVWQETFGRVPLGASLLYDDSEGHLAFADNQGNAAERLGLAVDRPVHVRPA